MSTNTGIIVAVIDGLLIAAIIFLIVFIAILGHSLWRLNKFAVQTSELIYDDPDTLHRSVPEASNQTANTGIPLQTQPQTKENVAYGTLPTHTILAPHFQLEENVAYGTHTNQQQENAAHPVQQQSMTYSTPTSQQQESVVQPPQPQKQQ